MGCRTVTGWGGEECKSDPMVSRNPCSELRILVRVVKAGQAEGEALVSPEPIGFLGGVDPDTGVVIESGHPLEGRCVAGRVLVFPTGKGSTVGSYTLYRLKRSRLAPAAIVNAEADPVVAVGAIIAEIPMVDQVDVACIRTGDWVRVHDQEITIWQGGKTMSELQALIPELDEIRDPELRAKVLAVWEEGMALGGWTVEALAEIPFTLLAEDVNVTFIEHVRTVCRMCLAMEQVLVGAYGERVEIDHDTLVAGALLADVGKLLEYRREPDGETVFSDMYRYMRHPFTGVALAYKHSIPEGALHVIATHAWEGDKFKRRPESIIFHHADFTDFDLVRFK
jgi:predicted aconitase with swiveling domain